MNNLSAPTHLKKHIVKRENLSAHTVFPGPLETEEQINEGYEHFYNQGFDYRNDIREGEFETGLPAPYNRHYECESVAARIDGRWIGWTYWHGGGKHGDPDGIEWIEDAYFLDCVEKEVVAIERTWTKV